MKQCWDADPSNRPDIGMLGDGIYEILQFYQSISNEIFQQESNNNLEKNRLINNSIMSKHINSKSFTSKIHQFKNLPEPRNATEEEQEDDSDKSFNDLQIINSNEGNYGIEIMEQQQIKKHNIKKHNIDIDDEDEIYDDKNFHSEEQDELEITDGKYFSYY
ncbi:kinase-like domain-containing protein [Rhizophagus irregularis DAOM 181602=DAOM 197198]|nr:kinase-like domain-containing protein [Rhizophagus irregularis DAOM 181602=DAOM 197198]